MQILNIRGKRVVLDRDLAAAFGVETKLIKRNVKRHPELFISDDFAFEMTEEECLWCLADTTNHSGRGGSRYLPIAITEKGVQVLKSIMKSYVEIEFEEEVIEAEVLPESWNEGTVVLYQPNEDIKIENLSENMKLDGRLPWKEAATLKVEKLNSQLIKLQEKHNKNLTMIDPIHKELSFANIILDGDISKLYQDEAENIYRYYISSSNLFKDKTIKFEKVIEDFIYHIFAKACGVNMITKIISLDGNKKESEAKEIVLNPVIDIDYCKNLLNKYCDFYLEKQQPFPIVPEAYFAKKYNEEKNSSKSNTQKKQLQQDKTKYDYEYNKKWLEKAENSPAILWTFPRAEDLDENLKEKIQQKEEEIYLPIFSTFNEIAKQIYSPKSKNNNSKQE